MRSGQVRRDERPPVGWHRVAEMETRRRCGRPRRWDGRRERRIERLPELRGDAVLDRPYHVRHLVAQETYLLDRRGPHAGSQSRRKQQAHIGRVIAIETVHGPALPIAVAPAVGGTNCTWIRTTADAILIHGMPLPLSEMNASRMKL